MFDKEKYKEEVFLKYQAEISNTSSKNTIRKNKFEYFKVPIAIFCSLILMTTFTFATSIIKKDKKIKHYNNSDGIETAIEDGYIEKTNMEFINSEGTELIIDDYLMDDFNLSFTFDIKLPNEIKVNNIVKANLSDFIITDNDNNIIFCDDERLFNDFVVTNYLDYKYHEYNEKYINNGSNIYIKEKNVNNNSIKLVYNLYANNYPKSKKLYLKICNLNLFENEEIGRDGITIRENWELSLDVPEKFYNREAIIYKVKKCSDEKIYYTEAVVYDTCMKFCFIKETEKIFDDNDTEEEIHKKLYNKLEEDAENWRNGINQTNSSESYVETENGEKYYPVDSSTEDAGYHDRYLDGIFEYWQTFSLTKNNTSDNLKIVINVKGQEYCFELVK